ncbi:MAG TPA: carbohydrate ABC transporter permease, partial [Lachnospiraceae bacterium]|nr:carbohydrate ABC transporter permease [Lachnospiraceae bacterium]
TTVKPVYLMTMLGCGLRSGLFIYIFIQFFRGIPKELEEAAFVDGAGAFRTYFTIMLPNAVPSLITVTVFSLVWQYNDSFYSGLFGIKSDYLLSVKLASLTGTINSLDQIVNPEIQQAYLDAGIVLMVVPIVIIYIILQRKFIEGVERSGIVG